jgi:integrase
MTAWRRCTCSPFHDLRHSAASLLLAQGVAPRVVMDELGHSQISVTMNTYSHVLPPLVDAAAEAIDRALTGPYDEGDDQDQGPNQAPQVS